MSNISNEHLQELTAAINVRLSEFGANIFHDLPPGIVRIAHDVIQEYWGMDLPDAGDWPKARSAPMREPAGRAADAPANDLYDGYARANAQPRMLESEQLVTISAPEPITVAEPNGNGHYADSVADPMPREPSFEADRVAIVRELQKMAMGNHMPTQAAWNMARPVNLPKADTLCKRYALNWTDLAAEAGLALTPRQAKMSNSTDEPF